jgi:hypothetical protein
MKRSKEFKKTAPCPSLPRWIITHKEHVHLSSQVKTILLIFIIEHTDPGVDFFEEGWRIKYKSRYKMFLRVRHTFKNSQIVK